MKKVTALIAALLTVLCITLSLSGCGDDESNTSETNSEATALESETTASADRGEIDKELLGTWRIVKEDGTEDTLFSYVFNKDKAILVMDNVAYYSDYSIAQGTDEKNTVTVQLYYNLNGTFEYAFSDDGSTVTFTSAEQGGTDFSMKKAEDYNPVPSPPENPVIDKKLVGKWKDKEGSGMSYEFKDNGIMINDSFGIMTLYARYSAENGAINLNYKQGTEVEDSYSYSFDGDVLTIDGAEFEKE